MTSDWRLRAQPISPQEGTVNAFVPSAPQPTQQGTPPIVSDWRRRAIRVEVPQGGFVRGVQDQYQNNLRQMQESAEAYVAGEQSLPETMIQQGTAYASIVPDTVFEGLAAVTPQAVKDAGMAAARTVGSIPAPGGGTIGEAIPREINEFTENYPRASRNIRAGMDALGLAATPTVLGAGVTKVGQGGANVVNRFTRGKQISGTTQDLKRMAQAAYTQADEMGARFTPAQVGQPFNKKVNAYMPKPIAGKVLTTEQRELASNLAEFKRLGRSSLSFDDVMNLDKSLTDKIKKFVDQRTGELNNTGRVLTDLQTDLRSILDDIPENAANDALINARRLWRAKSIMDDLDTIAERAAMTQNPKTSIQSGLRNLIMDKRRTRGWPPEALELMRKAATPGLGDDVLQLLSSRLPAIIMGGTGNLGGAATAHVVGAAGRNIGSGIAANRVARVQQSVIDDALGNLRTIPPQAGVDTPLLLASPTAMGSAPMSGRQVNIARRQMRPRGTQNTTDEVIQLPPEPPTLRRR